MTSGGQLAPPRSEPAGEMTPNSILLFSHSPFYRLNDTIFFDTQAQNGLRLYTENFDVVRIMAPLVEDRQDGLPSGASALKPFLEAHPTVEPVMLPRRGTIKFLTQDLRRGRKIIREKIAESQYLVFGFSGYIGDWGTVSCRTAARMGRSYAVFKDLVGHRSERIYQRKMQRSAPRRLLDRLKNILMEYSDRQVVRGSALALLHGRDTLDYYSAFASNPQLVHNIHISKADHISEAALTKRLEKRDPNMLNLSYAGRVEEVKGPDDWVRAIEGALHHGTRLSATWYGTGVLLEAQRKQVADRGLQNNVTFAGFVDHKQMLSRIRASDIFLFTHLTEESPRCLIEALSMGLPLVGYDSAYPRDLVGNSQAGLFVARGDTEALSRALKELSADPERLKAMALDARRVAEPLNDVDVFRHRSDIIKEAL